MAVIKPLYQTYLVLRILEYTNRRPKKKQRFPVSNANDSSAASDSNCGSDSESDPGYSSNSSLDLEAEHYRKVRAEFVVAGPNLANPCPTTKKMMEREEQKWKLQVAVVVLYYIILTNKDTLGITREPGREIRQLLLKL